MLRHGVLLESRDPVSGGPPFQAKPKAEAQGARVVTGSDCGRSLRRFASLAMAVSLLEAKHGLCRGSLSQWLQ